MSTKRQLRAAIKEHHRLRHGTPKEQLQRVKDANRGLKIHRNLEKFRKTKTYRASKAAISTGKHLVGAFRRLSYVVRRPSQLG